MDSFDFTKDLKFDNLKSDVQNIKSEIKKVIIGQEETIDLLIISLFSNGHSLLEGVPGIAKTVLAKVLAKTISSNFSRIQFTPDLMPADVLGTSIFNSKTLEFEFKKGPIFSNIILIDEINRAPAKTQSALFEVMAERQITIDGNRFEIQKPFVVFATQNPIEQEGTYRLPEAQLDRFLFKINIDYPSLEEEINILRGFDKSNQVEMESSVNTVLSANQLIEYQKMIQTVQVEDQLLTYIANVVNATRNNPFLYLGASPRASIAILTSSKTNAALNGRDFIIPEDIKKVAHAILSHRIILSPEKEMEGITNKQILDEILSSTEIPR